MAVVGGGGVGTSTRPCSSALQKYGGGVRGVRVVLVSVAVVVVIGVACCGGGDGAAAVVAHVAAAAAD